MNTQMKKNLTILLGLSLSCLPLMAQNGVTQCGVPTGQERFPLKSYIELPDHDSGSGEAWKQIAGPQVSWGSIDVRYAKKRIPEIKKTTSLKIEGWKGESVHAQAVIWTPCALGQLNFEMGDFTSRKGTVLPKESFRAGFVRYVMTDGLNKDGKGACGHRPDHSLYDSTLVADPIDGLISELAVSEKTTQAIWFSCDLPRETPAGIYKGVVTIQDGSDKLADLELQIRVIDRTLPAPHDWQIHVDLWQNPFAVARYYQVEPWSKEHFAAMEPIFRLLASAGQKVITTSIMHKPWNGQTEDYFESMVTWTKKLDGTWRFDFDVFDAWVEFMMGLGIDQQINCYTMIPWALSYQYFDQRTNSLKFANTQPGEKEFEEMWVAMLSALSQHLHEKGWFEKTTIAMDERPMDSMLKTIQVIRKADERFKISLAGNWHEELDEHIYDYCIPIGAFYPEDALSRRQMNGKHTTYYTCCTEPYPNGFTFSPAAENEWISFYCAKEKVDGYLKWAFNSWPLEPLLDSRFRSWAGGDTYIVYPGVRSSIRFERMKDGFENFEKIRILRAEFEKTGNRKGLEKLEQMLEPFVIGEIPAHPAAETVQTANRTLNRL